MKVAIVHDWLVTYGGAERVLEVMLDEYPEADVFALLDFVPGNARGFLRGKSVRTSFLQHLPFARTRYRNYLPLMPLAVEQLDMSAYDLVISSSSAVAKGVITGPDQLHICMCYTPMRYAWDLSHQYLGQTARAGARPGGWVARYILHKMRIWDVRTANGVDEFIAISDYIARRIWKVYRRKATVIYPPVNVHRFVPGSEKADFYLTASRLVPYKRVDLIVEAFSAMPDKKLIVIGEGPEMPRIRRKAGSNVEVLGQTSSDVLVEYMQRARAFVFAAEEDFGIVAVEALACGTPVIAYAKGAALETVTPQETGLFFDEQTSESIVDAVWQFEREMETYRAEAVRRHAMRFADQRFRDELRAFVAGAIDAHGMHDIAARRNARVRHKETRYDASSR